MTNSEYSCQEGAADSMTILNRHSSHQVLIQTSTVGTASRRGQQRLCRQLEAGKVSRPFVSGVRLASDPSASNIFIIHARALLGRI